jgi:hypothetical protein
MNPLDPSVLADVQNGAMAVLPQTPEVADDPEKDPAAELAELRRRAYGPDADIDADAGARARLQELEDDLRATPRASSHAVAPAPEAAAIAADTPVRPAGASQGVRPEDPEPPLGTVESAQVVPSGVQSAEAGTEAGTEAESQGDLSAAVPARDSSRLRRFARAIAPSLGDRRTWIIGGAGALIGAAVAAGLLAYPWDQPDRVLHPQSEQPKFLSSEYGDFLRELGAKDDTERAFDAVGRFTPWSIELEAGGRCLLVTEDSRNLVNMACAAEGMDPVLDLLPGLWGSRLQEDHTLRFIARRDRVDVWFGGPQPTTDSAESAPVT